MRVYADTNFFVALFCPGPHVEHAVRLQTNVVRQGAPAYPVTLLGRLEFVNALQLSVFCTRNGVPGVRMNREQALLAEAAFVEQLAQGATLRPVTVDERLLEQKFQHLSHRHTAKDGFRTYDLLHVSSALVLGCDAFWSFDDKARKLAKLEGLAVN